MSSWLSYGDGEILILYQAYLTGSIGNSHRRITMTVSRKAYRVSCLSVVRSQKAHDTRCIVVRSDRHAAQLRNLLQAIGRFLGMGADVVDPKAVDVFEGCVDRDTVQFGRLPAISWCPAPGTRSNFDPLGPRSSRVLRAAGRCRRARCTEAAATSFPSSW